MARGGRVVSTLFEVEDWINRGFHRKEKLLAVGTTVFRGLIVSSQCCHRQGELFGAKISSMAKNIILYSRFEDAFLIY